MTKLRKLTALLLAGALTLLLLTACSGGGGSSGPEGKKTTIQDFTEEMDISSHIL